MRAMCVHACVFSIETCNNYYMHVYTYIVQIAIMCNYIDRRCMHVTLEC